MKSLKNKIIFVNSICVLITSIIIASISLHYSSFIAKQDAKSILQLTCENNGAQINTVLKSIEQSVNALSFTALEYLDDLTAFKTDSNYVNNYTQKLLNTAQSLGKNTPCTISVYVRYNPEFTSPTSGIFLFRNNTKSNFELLTPTDFSCFDPSDTEHVGWYYTPIKNGKPTWMPLYMNANVNSYMISYVIPLFKDGISIGIVGIDIDFSLLTELVTNTKVLSSGYAALIDEQGKVLSHPSLEMGTDLSDVFSAASLKEIGSTPTFLTYSYEHSKKILASYPLENHMTLLLTAPMAEMNANSVNLAKYIGIICLVSMILSYFIGYFLSLRISTPLKQLTTIIYDTSNFNFVVNKNSVRLRSLKDETGDMARAIHVMRKQLREIVGQIDTTADTLSKTTSRLSDITSHVSSMCMDNSATTEQLSAGMEETAATTTDMAHSLTNVKENAKDIAHLSNDGQKTSIEIANRANHLKEETLTMTDKIKVLYTDVSEKTKLALEKAKAVDKINELTQQITAISDQTSLLSLNASIEAARAGEAGRGFSVVATEISKLAQQTAEAVGNINQMVTEVTGAVDNMANCLTDTNTFLGQDILEHYKTFNEIGDQYVSDANLFKTDMNAIYTAITSLSDTITQITDCIEGISITINEASGGVLNIATKTSDMVRETSLSSEAVTSNTTNVEALKEIVKRFSLN